MSIEFGFSFPERLPGQDRVDYQQFFEEAPSAEKPEDVSPHEFAKLVAYRVYVEFCLTHDWEEHQGYSGKEYEQWIADEVHYEMERQLAQLSDAEREQVDGEKLYAEVRVTVLRAAFSRAMELFSDWGWSVKRPPADDKRNLQSSLQGYIQKLEEVA